MREASETTPPIEADEAELVELPAPEGCVVRLLREVADAFVALQTHASEAGISILPVSGYRSIERQRGIWERKFEAACADGLAPETALSRVMEYSAPPGWSRHHWATDLDLIDAALRETPRLEPEDWEPGGPCEGAFRWLEDNAARFGFYRPYDVYRGGYRAEPWHWSHRGAAAQRLEAARGFDWAQWFRQQGFAGAEPLARDAEVLCQRYVLDVAPALR